MRLKFSGSRVLILGGTCELALCLAEYLIKAQLYPVLSCRNKNGRQQIESSLSAFKEKFETVYLDLNDADSIKSIFSQNNQPDYLVDFAQSNLESLIASESSYDINRYFAENISFRAEIIKTAARGMLKKKGGRLIFISSAAALRPNPGQGFYAAAKLASEALYKNLGLEMGSKGITTVSLRPGYINAGRGKKFIKQNKKITDAIPVKRAIEPGEVAETILFLLSESARSFNAVEITMDGGMSAGKLIL